MIDTMNGYENVKQVAEHFTDLPLMVVNTHGHPDHVYGNIYFDKAYMNPADEHVVAKYCADPRFVEATTQMGLRMPPFEPIGEGDVIDLGGLKLCQGRKENDEPYSWFGGVCRAHPYGKEPRRIVYDDNLIHTPRMLLRMMSDEEMQKIIEEEKDPEMVQAYQEMYTGCLEHPEQRPWYVIWGMELPDGTRPSGCLKRPALCQTV